MSNICWVNGKKYVLPSGSVSVVNGEVYCNGKKVVDCNSFKEKTINITIEGSIDHLECADSTVTINGNCTDLNSGSGDVNIKGNVNGNVTSGSGDISCGDVGGDIQSGSGDIKCGEVNGNVNTMSGDITHSVIRNIGKKFGNLFSSKGDL